MEKVQSLKEEALAEVQAANDIKALNDVRVKYLGKKGPITEVLRGMGSLSPEERPAVGQAANEVRAQIAGAIEEKQRELNRRERERQLADRNDRCDPAGTNCGAGSDASAQQD